ncbi:MAG TPA: pilus assembly protein PilM [Candidatus Baltobacteraceae bacterium]|nr:pilus assembly protein PilM [Candidatus Baltobacteraceae bacterium]
MGDWKPLPLGIDLGSTRVRVAVAEKNHDGEVRVRAVAARDVPEDAVAPLRVEQLELVAAVVEEALSEVGTRERRCVLALGAPACALRTVRFPKMTWPERVRAARFEAQRFAGWDLEEEESIVRIHPIDRDTEAYAIGVARKESIDSRVRTAHLTGLRVIAIDHDAFALRRLFPDCDAIVDVGAERSSLHVFGPAGPLSFVVQSGGGAITRGIAQELSIDLPTAERRKRILGCAGAGVSAHEDVVTDISALVERARTRAKVDRIAVTGNGARIPSFTRELEDATGALTETPVPDVLHTDAYPEDVVRVAAPDWALAASLAAWSLTA